MGKRFGSFRFLEYPDEALEAQLAALRRAEPPPPKPPKRCLDCAKELAADYLPRRCAPCWWSHQRRRNNRLQRRYAERNRLRAGLSRWQRFAGGADTDANPPTEEHDHDQRATGPV